MMVSFVLSFFPRDVLDEILNLIESVSEDFPSYSYNISASCCFSVSLDKEITICSVYIPPNFQLQSQHIDSLLEQLPSPYLLLGDFNGHNILWGCNKNNTRGWLVGWLFWA